MEFVLWDGNQGTISVYDGGRDAHLVSGLETCFTIIIVVIVLIVIIIVMLLLLFCYILLLLLLLLLLLILVIIIIKAECISSGFGAQALLAYWGFVCLQLG